MLSRLATQRICGQNSSSNTHLGEYEILSSVKKGVQILDVVLFSERREIENYSVLR